MRHLYLLVTLTLALVAPARRPGRHAPDAIHPPLPRRRCAASRVLPAEPAPPDVEPEVAVVRPYLIAHERRREQERADRNRLGVAVLMDIADPADTPAPVSDMGDLAEAVRAYLGTTGAPPAMWHCPAPGCHMSAPYPTGHPCPLPAAVHDEGRPLALEVAR